MILVTGSNGFLGSAVVEQLLAQTTDEAIVCLVRPNSSTTKLDALVGSNKRCSVRRGTLSSPSAAAQAIEGADVIYHLAAGMGGGAMADVWLSTVVATRNLLDAMDGATVRRMLHCSSFGVYGTADLPPNALVDESTPLEPRPAERDNYSHAKLRQELLVRERLASLDTELVVVRPGMVYGPGGNALSGRIGLKQGRLMIKFGRDNDLPITYVTNCAEAIVIAGQHPEAAGEVYNICDDDLTTVKTYMRQYNKLVERMLVVPVPWPATKLLARAVERYHHASNGQLPAVLTPYDARSAWGSNTFSNRKIRSLGWTPKVSTDEGMRRNFEYLRAAAQATSPA